MSEYRGLPHGEILGACRKAVAAEDTGLAAAAYLRVARANPGEIAAQALAELARLHLMAERPDDFYRHLAEALSHDGACALALALRARALGAQGDEKGFVRLAERCLSRLEITERERLMDLAADLLLERGAFRRFAKLALEAVRGLGSGETTQVTPVLAGALAVAARRTNTVAPSVALAVLEPVLARAIPGSMADTLRTLGAHLLCLLADEAIEAGDGGRAIQLFERAMVQDPELGSARVGQGRLLVSLGHFEEAVEVLKPAPALVGGGEAAWAVLGRAFLELGKLHHAEVCAERAGLWARKDRDLWRLLKK